MFQLHSEGDQKAGTFYLAPSSSPSPSRGEGICGIPASSRCCVTIHLWFDKLTMRGPWHLKNQLLAMHLELVEGRIANSATASKMGGIAS